VVHLVSEHEIEPGELAELRRRVGDASGEGVMEPLVRWLLTYLVHSTLLLAWRGSPASPSASGGSRCRRRSCAPP